MGRGKIEVRRIYWVRAFAAMVVLNALLGSDIARGSVDGDPEWLRQVVAANDDNLKKIKTWVGEAEVDVHLSAGDQEQRSHLKVSFFIDVPNGMKRWHTVDVSEQVNENGTFVDAPSHYISMDEMITPDGFFTYHPGARTLITKEVVRTLEIIPLDKMAQFSWPPRSFAPFFYMSDTGQPVSSVLQGIITGWSDSAASATRSVHITKQGNIIQSESRRSNPDFVYNLTFDLAVGGNLTQSGYQAPEGASQKDTVDYQSVGGIWIPSKFTEEHNEAHLRSATTVTFAQNQINVALDPKTFILEAMGILPKTHVTDNRNGTTYYFGDASPDNLPQSPEQATAATSPSGHSVIADSSGAVAGQLGHDSMFGTGLVIVGASVGVVLGVSLLILWRSRRQSEDAK